MRLYTFSHFMLSSIQQTLQGGHAQAELFVKYREPSEQNVTLYDWATNHKTWVSLNGGNSSGLHSMLDFLQSANFPFPWAPFYEDESSLETILTSIAIVLPERIIKAIEMQRFNRDSSLTGFSNVNSKELEFVKLLASMPLAR
jgi:hypothetical protein